MLDHWASKENKIGCCSAVLLQENSNFSCRRLEGVEVLYLVRLYILYLFTYSVAVNSLTCVLMLFVNDKISF